MKLLAIETTGAKASAAVIDEEGRLTLERSEETMNHLQHLIPMIDQLLSNCGMSIDDVSVIAISEGPGSFTGIRIGMATAKALAQVLNAPVIGVPTLRSFAWNLPDYHGLVCPVFDAKRSQVYAGVYQLDEAGVCRQLLEDGAYDLPDYLDGLIDVIERVRPEGISSAVLFGDGAAPYGQRIADAVEAWNAKTDRISPKDDFCLKIADESARYQSAASVAALGRLLFEGGKAGSYTELHPVYLRKAEAERKLAEAEAKK